MLNESYKLDAEEKLHQITINAVPHMKEHDATDVINTYKAISRDIIEVLEEDDNYDNIAKLKGEL